MFELDDLDSIDQRLSSLDDNRRLRLQWPKARANHSDHVLLHALCRSLYLDFLLPVVPRVLLLGTTFAQPWLIQRLLQFTDEPTHKAREAVLLASATAATYVCLAVPKLVLAVGMPSSGQGALLPDHCYLRQDVAVSKYHITSDLDECGYRESAIWHQTHS